MLGIQFWSSIWCFWVLVLVDSSRALPLLNRQSGSFSGSGTYYNVGPGSCGETNSDTEMVVAVNIGQMDNGPNPNNNPHCQKMVSIKGARGVVKARVVDTCPGCSEGGLDMSPALFQRVCGDLGRGRCDIEWHYL
ncbi:RlpA-like double-psi beta-barrel-protein domain-containing protein-containing protein [Phycomyces nitens]|nr:RlpA-like double-psi beta-barrel-protein domain-containing protein-containing protein [Phycomyces nitens]